MRLCPPAINVSHSPLNSANANRTFDRALADAADRNNQRPRGWPLVHYIRWASACDNRLVSIGEELGELVDLTRTFNLHVPPSYFASEVGSEPYQQAIAPVIAPAGDEPLSLYLGVPMCEEHCNFCMYFYGFADREGAKARACVDGLTGLLNALRDVPRRRVAGMYVGGGTPSVLTADQISELLTAVNSTFAFEESAQRTFEMSPRSLTRPKLDALVAQGVKRISFGIQSFDPKPVELAGRQFHSPEAVGEMLAQAFAAGVEDANVDLMVGLAGESDDSLSESVCRLSEIGCPTVSIYRYRPMRQRELAARNGADAYVEVCQRRVDLAVDTAERVGFHASGRNDGEHIRLTRTAECPWPERNLYETRHRPPLNNSLVGIGSGARSFLRDARYINCEHRASEGFGLLDRMVEIESCTDHDRVAAALINELFREFRVDLAGVEQSMRVGVADTCGSDLDYLLDRGIVRRDGDVVSVVAAHRADWMYWDKVLYPTEWLQRRKGVPALRVR
jgi:oxygen-independent coproporphyrinogen-3 oxidase